MWINLLKIVIAGLSIGYLIYDGRLEPEKMKILFQNPLMVFTILSIWFFIVFPLASLRFKLFLLPFAKNLSFFRIFSLTMIGNFFNNTLPGVVSGDVIKGYYLNSTADTLKKTEIAAVLIIDRVVGLIGLITIGIFGLLLSIFFNIQIPKIVFVTFGVLFLGIVLFYSIIFTSLEDIINRLIFRTKIKETGIRASVRNVINHLHIYRRHIPVLISTFLMSCIIQLCVVLVFFMISQHFYAEDSYILKQMVVIPPGMIAVALPLSPAGIGIGHLGFEALYNLVGLDEGANIFNIFILLQILVNLTGVFFYLFQGKIFKTIRQ